MADDSFAQTYLSLRILGEHVLAPTRYAAEGHIGLTVVPGGIATPPFGEDQRTVSLLAGELTVSVGGEVRTAAITTVRAAAAFVGVTPGAPTNVYTPSTPCDLDTPLPFDQGEFGRIAEWYALVADALTTFAAEVAPDSPAAATLWPEHFDIAIRTEDINYGGSGGDSSVTTPYVYVGPRSDILPSTPTETWNQPFGASRTWTEVTGTPEVLEFFRGRRAAAGAS
jgi:hypothetical protein